MNLLKNTIFLLLLLSASVFGQKSIPQVIAADNQLTANISNIRATHESDSAFLKVELNNAQYDLHKNNLPFYVISKRTAYNQTAIPHIIIKKTQIVTENHAAVINKYLGKFIGRNFETAEAGSLCMMENLNRYKLYPFRKNGLNQIEELVEYDINWQITANQNRLSSAASFTSNSILASGTWYKIAILNTGIYKLDKSFFALNHIDASNVNPNNIRIYGNSGNILPEMNNAFRYDDLQENAIQFVGNADNAFANDEYVLFYATNKDKWTKNSSSSLKFNVQQNFYSDTTFYFLNFDIGPGKRIVTQGSTPNPENVATSSYDYYNYHEQNTVNFVKSGRQFYGENFDLTTSYGFTFNDGDFVTGDTIISEVTIAGRGATATSFNISGNGLYYNLISAPVQVDNYLAPYADVQTATSKALNTDASAISLVISKQTPSNIGWLDKFTVNARRNIVIRRQFQFRDSRVAKPGNICKYNISNQSNTTASIWNVSDIINPYIQSFNQNGGSLDFKVANDSVLEFAAAPDNDYYTPLYVGTVPNQNLHSLQQADYVIVTHPLFVSQAQRLADLHQRQEGLTYVIATTQQIYNEFSSGMVDICGIRDFTRMLYSRNLAAGKQPRYVLLFGDGSYDNRNHNIVTNSCLIPTYETLYSLSAIGSIASDDFYALMDPTEGFNAENAGSLDIGVGRLTCRSIDEANAVVGKIENYYRTDANFKIEDPAIENCNISSESTFGDWKNWLLFLADDEDQSTHMHDANQIADKVKLAYPLFSQDKIFLDSYQQFSTPGGQRYPDAYIDVQKRISKGTLVFNYTGHGGEVGLTAERLIDVETINAWDNFNKLPLFVTATCEFTRYDDPARTSAGELCLLNPKGGAIALFTTCRLAFSNSNLTLNSTLYDYMFKNLPGGKKPCLGDIVRGTKNALSQSINYSNFHLIGDPAVTLSYPQKKVFTSKINTHVVTGTGSDTLSALDKITVTGFVSDTLGNKITNFNGLVYPTVFDKEIDVSGLLNDESSYYLTPGSPFIFKLQKNILYRGKAEVKDGNFTFSFIVPKDISFAYGPGKINYYATNGTTDASGYYQKVVVGGGAKNVPVDNDGPSVNMYLNDKNFVNGGTTNEKPILYAHLTDSSGINTLGTSIGHDITAVLDGNISKPVVLNDYYEANLNSYQSGRIRYPFEKLSEGNHSLSFKVWDIQNNSNVVKTDFVVAPSAELALKHVLNYPNPFTTSTKFFFEHNQACNPLKVTVQIFTVSGKLIKTLQKDVVCEGFRPEGIDWDGKDDYGDKIGRGVYLYKIAILNTDNKRAEKTEKLVILN